MQIAASQVSSAPASSSADAASATAPDGADAGAVAATAAARFGGMLSLRLATTADGTDLPPAPRAAQDGAGDRATNLALPATADPSSLTSADVASPTTAAKVEDATDPTVGDDLAAQLALVAQWAAVAHPQAATEAASRDDIGRKLDTVRGTAATATVAVTVADTSRTAASAIVPVESLPVTTTRDARTPAAASPKADAARSGDLRAAADAASGRSDAVQTSIEKLLALAGTSGHAVSADNANVANAFVTQVVAQAAPNPASSSAPVATAMLHETVGTPAWTHEVGQATLRMASNDLQNVSLHLNPEHLGPLDVRMRVDDGVAHLQFVAAHPDTRQALESSRATLDQLFGQQGIKLGDWSVGQQAQRDTGAATSQGNGGGRSSRDAEPVDVDTTTLVATVRATRGLGLVDTFA